MPSLPGKRGCAFPVGQPHLTIVNVLRKTIIDQAAIKKIVEVGVMENAKAQHGFGKGQRSCMKIVIVAEIQNDHIILQCNIAR